MSVNRILVVVDGLPLGGTERQVVELLRGLRRSGRYETSLAVLDRGGLLETDAGAAATDVVPVRRRTLYDVTVAADLLAYVRRHGVRLIHGIGWMSALAAMPAARLGGVPIINGSIRSAPARLGWRDRISRWCAMHSDAIVANSHGGLTAFGLTDHARAQVIFNGIDVGRLRSLDAPCRERPTICMVANFNAWKDHRTAIRAMSPVTAAVPDAELLLVGHDRGTLESARTLIRELRLHDSVTVVQDSASSEDRIAASHVCLLASHVEGCSNVILEYLALGKPVVASDTCGDIAWLAKNASAAFLYPDGSPGDLAAHVIRLLRDHELARRMGGAGRREAAAFTVDRMVGCYESLYARLIER